MFKFFNKRRFYFLNFLSYKTILCALLCPVINPIKSYRS